jgi:hypothetical protein
VTGARNETAFAREGEKARIEADEIAIVLGDGGGEIIEPDLAARAREEGKGVNVTPGESLEGLTMGELQIHLAAVRFDQAKGVKLACGAVVNQRAKVAPVHVEPLASRRFDALPVGTVSPANISAPLISTVTTTTQTTLNLEASGTSVQIFNGDASLTAVKVGTINASVTTI